MSLESFIRAMPKVELHVHLGGSILPETLLLLARRNGADLPARTLEELRDWYRFTDFAHFIDVYKRVQSCVTTPDDIELIAREFLAGQAKQGIRYTEITHSASRYDVPFRDQLKALNRAADWALAELGVASAVILDIPREFDAADGLEVADWAIEGAENGVVALGLGGMETGNPPEKFRAAFDRAHAAGVACVPHAGEVVGAESIWGALRHLHADRIQHGVRCLEDPDLVTELRDRQIPLGVCVGSNIALGICSTWQAHPLGELIDAGLLVTLSSDDPPMFNTTLTDEFLNLAEAMSWTADDLERLVLNGV
ncbi:MAG TPA: adenosine deaminase, partial [Dehalococcoidia bacterium]|nr:adenosine deaminase [Dehalococcoidia bacterium]